MWKRVVAPYFQCANYPFVACTSFGSRISGNTADLIQCYIYYFGVWEPHLTHFISRRLKPADIFVDVGANIGYFTLLGSHLVGEHGKVIAIEASPSIHRMLVENLERNGVRNATVFNVAASDRVGRLKIFLADNGNLGQTTTISAAGFKLEAEISARALSELIAREDWPRLKLIKIDVEGAEWSVISGMRALLEHASDSLEIVAEITAGLAEAQQTAADIVALFARYGFHAYCLRNEYSSRDYVSREEPLAPSRIRSPIDTQTDVVFSRIDADYL
jgi:FkbM family methyltransferase